MAGEVRWSLVFLFIFYFLHIINANIPKRRFEYKYSFKPPYLAQRDGSVPFWQYGGDAIASAESVRVAPSLKSKKGAIWTKSVTNFRWWEVDIVFRVNGRGRIGADGLAFWYTTHQGAYDGTVFGSSDQWNGLGVFFDSFDNDNKHNNPYIMAMINDGTKQFDHANDGALQMQGGCLRDFRNKPFPTRAKIEYYQNVLTVLFHNGMTNNENDFEVCLRLENVFLPEAGFFGLSAATGGLADDHDVFHFLTTSLSPPGTEQQYQGAGQGQGQQVNSEEQQKLTREYQEYQNKLEQQKQEYQREHPEARKESDSDFDEWFESDSQRELRQIFSGQSQMFDVLKDLHRKLDEVVGRQERLMSIASAASTGQHPPPAHGGAPPPGGVVPSADSIRRHEVDLLIQNQNVLVSLTREIRTLLGDVQSRTDQVLQNQARQPTAHVQSVGYDMSSLVNQVREGLSSIEQTVARVATPAAHGGAAPPQVCQPCLTTTSYLIFSAIMLLLILGYSIIRDRQSQQSKKFY